MAEEPDPDLHHIFDEFETAQAFYEKLLRDQSLSDQQRELLKEPRQAHRGFWIIDKVK